MNSNLRPLSAREATVAELVARGHSSKEIGSILFLSPHTVHTHVRNIFRKCGARNRAQLVAWWCDREAAGIGRPGGRTEPKGKLLPPRMIAAAIAVIVAMIAFSPSSNSHTVATPEVLGTAHGAPTYRSDDGLPPVIGGTAVCEQMGGETGSNDLYVCQPRIVP